MVDDSKEHEKAKGINKNVTTTISHNAYDILLNNKCLKHPMNRIQSKSHRIGTYEINKTSLPCFNDKKDILNDGSDGLSFHLSVLWKKNQLFYELKTAFYETIKKYFHFLFSQNILLSSCKNMF